MQNFPLNFLTFPVWWYTVGIKIAFLKAKANFGYGVKKTGLVLFARHLGEPLYGDYTRTGRIVSFFLRIVLIFFKLLLLTFRAIFLTAYLLGYLIILPCLIILLIWQFLPAK